MCNWHMSICDWYTLSGGSEGCKCHPAASSSVLQNKCQRRTHYQVQRQNQNDQGAGIKLYRLNMWRGANREGEGLISPLVASIPTAPEGGSPFHVAQRAESARCFCAMQPYTQPVQPCTQPVQPSANLSCQGLSKRDRSQHALVPAQPPEQCSDGSQPPPFKIPRLSQLGKDGPGEAPGAPSPPPTLPHVCLPSDCEASMQVCSLPCQLLACPASHVARG